MTKTASAPQPKSAAPTSNEFNPVAENTTFTLSVNWETVAAGYKKVLAQFVANAELDGFRKGKAPANKVEDRVGKQKLYEATIEYILPEAYAAYISEHKLQPVAQPHVSPKTIEENKPWEFEVSIAQAPTFTLGDYKKVAKEAKPSTKIWTPGDPQADKPQTDEDKRSEHLQAILKALLDHVQIAIPELLIREEVNASLSRMLSQLEKIRVSLEDYLKSMNKTVEQLRQEYASSALASLQLEFILARIAAEEKLHVEKKEIDEVIASIPDPAMRAQQDNEQVRRSLESNILRRKTLDFLLAL